MEKISSFINILLCILLILLEINCKEIGKPEKQKRICVIGAGYSGLGTARYLQKYGLNFTVFEATRYVGGVWRYDPHVEKDEDGLPIFTGIFKNLKINTPRQIMEYADFAFSNKTPSHISGDCFYKYIKSYTKHFGLQKYIQFQSLVTSVKWKGDHWSLTYFKTDTKVENTEQCDFVVVANGYHNKAKKSHFKGQESFKGKIIHSKNYKEPTPFKNRSVLIVGGGASSLDVVSMLSNVTTKLVHSHHRHINQSSVGENVITKPDIDRFTPDGVVFQDGSFEEVDDVILCIGYEFDHGFLDESSGLAMSPKTLMPLYQYIVNIQRPSMDL